MGTFYVTLPQKLAPLEDRSLLYVRSSSGETVPLNNLVSVSEQATPPQIFRFNRYMSATVSARPAPGNTIEDGINAMDRGADETLGPAFTTTLTGQSRDFQETSNQLLYVFGLALLLIYLVLAAQFESFRDPFIILLTVPLALAGAMLFLWYFNRSLNIFSQIGMIMLIGLVAKNGILIVEFANQRKAAGLSIREAIEEAAAISCERLRIVEVQREVGSASDLAVRQARVDLNADSAAVLRRQTALVNAKSRLNQLLGRSGDASVRYAVTTSIAVDTSLGHTSLQQTALQESPALEQARQALQAAKAERREARAGFFPTVDLTAGYGYSQLDAESGFLQSSTSTDLSYGVSLTFDLFDGLNRWRRTQNADIRATNARLAVEDVRSRLTTELTSAYEQYRNRLRLVALERQNLEAVQANVDVALEQFELGTITSVELREVQEQFVQAESRLLMAQFEAKQAEVELLRLSGQLLRKYGGM